MNPTRPLLVRLPNHLGDTLMTLPALERLAAAGNALTLLGKPWAGALLAAYPWPVVAVAPSWWATVGQVRALKRRLRSPRAPDPGAVLLTNSFGTAAAFALGGLRAAGFATEGRGWLLAPAVPLPARWSGNMHTVEYYDALVAALDHAAARKPPPLQLQLPPAATDKARRLLADAGVAGPYLMLCPGATGIHRGRHKTWGEFASLARALRSQGHKVVALPGPGERAQFETVLPGVRLLPPADVATFGALLAASRLVVANDSGPGHLAAAVGAQLVSVFGVTEPQKTRPWGQRVTVLGNEHTWPDLADVLGTVNQLLAGTRAG